MTPTLRPAACAFVACLIATVFAAVAAAGPAGLVLQGHMRTTGGGPVADGNYPMGIALYDAVDAAKPLYEINLLAVPVTWGVFSIDLGALDADKQPPVALFEQATATWIGVTIGADPELSRRPLHPAPYAIRAMRAGLAESLDCSGCIQAGMIATNAIVAKHVAFTYAGSNDKGGAAIEALHAIAADSAEVAKVAKSAETAALADKAISATSADDAQTASVAASLQCTGCVTAPMLVATVAADLVSAGKLAKVATSGSFGDLSGGPDLSAYARADQANTWAKAQTHDDVIDMNSHEIKRMRFENAAQDPVACDAAAIGLVYYNTADGSLRICDGTAFRVMAQVIPIGTQDNPGKTCKAVYDGGDASGDGTYWIDPDGGDKANAFSVVCDMKNGGWTGIQLHGGRMSAHTADCSPYQSWGTNDYMGSGHLASCDGNQAEVIWHDAADKPIAKSQVTAMYNLGMTSKATPNWFRDPDGNMDDLHTCWGNSVLVKWAWEPAGGTSSTCYKSTNGIVTKIFDKWSASTGSDQSGQDWFLERYWDFRE